MSRMMINAPIITLLALFLFSAGANAKRLQPEKDYQNYFAKKIGGEIEVTAGDRTRCDILTKTHAIEVDFADKWGEAIGQSLNYGFQFNRKAGIVLILESENDYRHFLRINSIIEHYNLPINISENEMDKDGYEMVFMVSDKVRNFIFASRERVVLTFKAKE